MAVDYDISYNDFNPSIFYVSKVKMSDDGIYHEHDYTEMSYVISGKARYNVEGEEFDVEAGDLVICNPGVKHTHIVVNPKEPTTELIMGFTDFQFKNMKPNSIELNDGGCVLHTTTELKQKIAMHCHGMIAEKESNQVGQYFMLKTHIMQILLLIVREIVDVERPIQKGYNFETYTKSYAVNRIVKYLNENYENKISLEQIAHNMYLSPVYISKIFKEETGESPINYLIKIRLEKAKEILLTEGSGSIKSIANQVGYDDVYHFSKLFKKYYGLSPLYYRKNAISKGNDQDK